MKIYYLGPNNFFEQKFIGLFHFNELFAIIGQRITKNNFKSLRHKKEYNQ